MPRVKKYNTEEMYNAPFPKLLRELMEKYHVSQEKIGNSIGVKRQTISKYANGETIPDIYSTHKIVNYFNVNYHLSYSIEYWLGKDMTFNTETKETINLSNASIEKLKKYQNSKIILLTLEILLSQEGFIKRLSEYLVTSSLYELIRDNNVIGSFAMDELHLNFNPYEDEKYKYANLLEILPKMNIYSKQEVWKCFLSNRDILFEYVSDLVKNQFDETPLPEDDKLIEQSLMDIQTIEKEMKQARLSESYISLVKEYADYELRKKVKMDEHKRKRKKQKI